MQNILTSFKNIFTPIALQIIYLLIANWGAYQMTANPLLVCVDNKLQLKLFGNNIGPAIDCTGDLYKTMLFLTNFFQYFTQNKFKNTIHFVGLLISAALINFSITNNGLKQFFLMATSCFLPTTTGWFEWRLCILFIAKEFLHRNRSTTPSSDEKKTRDKQGRFKS